MASPQPVTSLFDEQDAFAAFGRNTPASNSSSSIWRRAAYESIPSSLRLSEKVIEDAPADALAIDLGCGTGAATAALAESAKSAIGLDINLSALGAATKVANRKCRFVHGDAVQLPFADASFSFGLMQALLTVLSNLERRRAILEAHRVLRTGAPLWICDFMQNLDQPDYVSRYDAEAVENDYGSFVARVESVSGDVHAYQAHHFSEVELVNLTSNLFEISSFDTVPVTTATGNEAVGCVMRAIALP